MSSTVRLQYFELQISPVLLLAGIYEESVSEAIDGLRLTNSSSCSF